MNIVRYYDLLYPAVYRTQEADIRSRDSSHTLLESHCVPFTSQMSSQLLTAPVLLRVTWNSDDPL